MSSMSGRRRARHRRDETPERDNCRGYYHHPYNTRNAAARNQEARARGGEDYEDDEDDEDQEEERGETNMDHCYPNDNQTRINNSRKWCECLERSLLYALLPVVFGLCYFEYQRYITEPKPEVMPSFQREPVDRPDFALESSGGRIISMEAIPDSEPKTFLGFTLCEGGRGPQWMIRATTSPGECWAFQGNSAKAVVQLIGDVLIDGVSLSHIPSTISPSGNIDSAPKDFQIWGLDEPRGRRLLGSFSYDKNGPTTQAFKIDNSRYFSLIEFEVLSNHGNKDYTCVYRLQVHGTWRE